MNYKVVTLVKLLGVITVLAIISRLDVLSMSEIIGTGKKSAYIVYEKSFKKSLESCVSLKANGTVMVSAINGSYMIENTGYSECDW